LFYKLDVSLKISVECLKISNANICHTHIYVTHTHKIQIEVLIKSLSTTKAFDTYITFVKYYTL